jgi:hypothetical protein
VLTDDLWDYYFSPYAFLVIPENEIIESVNLAAATGNITPSELVGKNFVGYQAWFGTPTENGSWRNWANGELLKQNITVEMWPNTAEYPVASLQATPFTLGNGQNAKLFSSSHSGVIDLHFKWMQKYKIDGAILQFFLADVANLKSLTARLALLKNVSSVRTPLRGSDNNSAYIHMAEHSKHNKLIRLVIHVKFIPHARTSLINCLM